jgi:hypothetical protein
MKALTIWQPWASLIIAGAKPWEWRGWPAPRSIVGQRIVIHAGARAPRHSEIVDILQQLHYGDSSLIADIAASLLYRTHLASWPLSAGVGTAILGKPIGALEWAREHCKDGFDSDRIDHHKFAWPLTEIEPFEPIVPARGGQGLWNWAA